MTLDRVSFQAWLDREVAAWRSNDRVSVGDLSSLDAGPPLRRLRPAGP